MSYWDYFTWMECVDVDFKISYDEALESIPEEYIRKWLSDKSFAGAETPVNALLNDPVKRLEVIVTLRNQGYTVESA
jgi:hypothetical protein